MQWFIRRIALFIVVLNSAVNPLAYAFFKQDFNNKIKKLTPIKRPWEEPSELSKMPTTDAKRHFFLKPEHKTLKIERPQFTI